MFLDIVDASLQKRTCFLTNKSKNFRVAKCSIFLPRYLGKALFLKCEFSHSYENHLLGDMERTERTRFCGLC